MKLRSYATLSAAVLAALVTACAAERVVTAEGTSDKIEKPACDFVKSPNFTPADRKKGKINYIIIHTIEGSAKSCVNWFLTTESKVSAHYVIAKDGKITQMVRDEDLAWHAGVHLYNQEAIGIEHEGFAAKNLWTEAQMRASAKLSRWLCHTYGIPIDRKHLMGHTEIAPQRKTDPGPYFKWDLYLDLIKNPGMKVDLSEKKPAAGVTGEPGSEPRKPEGAGEKSREADKQEPEKKPEAPGDKKPE